MTEGFEPLLIKLINLKRLYRRKDTSDIGNNLFSLVFDCYSDTNLWPALLVCNTPSLLSFVTPYLPPYSK